MAACPPALSLLLALGLWVVPRGATLSPGEPSLRLAGGGCRCTGLLQAQLEGRWSRVCRDGVSEARARSICQQLDCGPPVPGPPQLTVTGGKEPTRAWTPRCFGPADTLARCRWVPANCTEHAVLVCSEPVKTTPEPPPAPPTTTPEPTGPPRLWLVDGDIGCSGFVELHRQGLWGAVAATQGLSPALATRLCHAVGCGAAIDGHGHPTPERGSHLPVRWEVVEPCESSSVLDCFNRTSAQQGNPPAFIVCSGSAICLSSEPSRGIRGFGAGQLAEPPSPPHPPWGQHKAPQRVALVRSPWHKGHRSRPQALRRLASGPTPCEGDIEVFAEGQWRVLCDNRARRAEWSRQLCRELRCGNLSSSAEIQDPPSTGVTCRVPTLHLCHNKLGVPQTCSRTRVTCQDSKPQPPGPAAGTIVSICLALLLFAILFLICGPPAYRRLMKRISKKKQRQWIGPTGLNQTVSFHRNSTATPRAQGQRAQRGDNDYAQPPQKSSQLLAYPALEGACRASIPLDNSSDSDYDLHSTRRL